MITEKDGVERLKADRTLTDITSLEKCEAFERYFLRRIREKREAAQTQAMRGATAEERERSRLAFLAFDEVSGLVEKDRALAKKALGQTKAPVQE